MIFGARGKAWVPASAGTSGWGKRLECLALLIGIAVLMPFFALRELFRG